MSNPFRTRKLNGTACLLIASLAWPSAHADDCTEIARLRSQAASGFRAMQMPSKDTMYVPSSFSMPGTNNCEIHLGLPEYRCLWYLSRNRDDREMARASFETVLASIQQCVAPPLDVSRVPRASGEIAYITDKLSGEDPNVSRTIELSYEKDGYWWVLWFVYRYGKEEQ